MNANMSGRQALPLTRIAGRLRLVAAAAALWLVVAVVVWIRRDRQPTLSGYRQREDAAEPEPAPRVPCFGPRGRLLSESPDDALQYGALNVSYPTPFIGSQRELGIGQTWMAADGRYGPYGFGQDGAGYARARVDWGAVDWARLQDNCSARNAARFARPPVRDGALFALKNQTPADRVAPRWDAFPRTGRTAVVVRAYSGFAWPPESLWSLRALVAEAALRTGADYAVFLLLHVQDRGRRVFASRESYDAALDEVPAELRSMSVLWDDELLESWYDKVDEHRTMWQVAQPLQLFARLRPDFDHFWQLELDQRFLGDAGEYLDAVGAFARAEPRKQALERATFAFRAAVYDSYANLSSRVDGANRGRSRAWGPLSIPDAPERAGPPPPVARPEDEPFRWGVGEPADVVVSSFCADVRQTPGWVFGDWFRNLAAGAATPRWFCPPAVARASRQALLLVHAAQVGRGVALPGEAVLPTFAAWHGLKLSYPPQPAYLRPGSAAAEGAPGETPWFGRVPEESDDGLSHGDPQSFADHDLTWWWASDWPRRLMDIWLAGNDSAAADLPGVLAVHDGKVYMPNFAMHPVKTE